ncbi:MAG: DCC1-like thiol-disulfide oxidoreductase family protein [Patescibacteria group bacterium]
MKNQLKEPNSSKQEIYYDGDCPMCKVIIEQVQTTKEGDESFNTNDFNHSILPLNITKEEVEKEIHVIDEKGVVFKNIDALIQILAVYPKYDFLVKIIKLPVIKQMFQIGYKFIALNRRFIFGEAKRIFWLKIVVILGLLSGLALSLKLWVGDRFFSKVPFFGGVDFLTDGIQIFLFTGLILSLFAVLIFPKPKRSLVISLCFLVLFLVNDQMRLQPWLYQYFFMLFGLSFFVLGSLKEEQTRSKILMSMRLLVASIYFFSGLQKLNLVFIREVFPWMMEPLSHIINLDFGFLLIVFGMIVPFLEMGIGIGLLFPKFRKYAIIFAFMMHSSILFLLGPFGHNWNSVVWPWNIAMILFVFILFYKTEDFSFQSVFLVKNFFFHKIILLLFVIMPFFSFFNLWDSYLSSTLYSGNTNNAVIYIESSVKEKLPSKVAINTKKFSEGIYELDIFNWSFNELNVPPYPEKRIYLKIMKDLCKYSVSDNDIVLVIQGKPTVFFKDQASTYTCLSI